LKSISFLIVSVLLFPSALIGQQVNLCPVSESKKAVKLYEEAQKMEKSRKDYQEMKQLLEESAAEDTSYAQPWLLLGNAAFVRKDFSTMKKAYTRLIQVCADADALAYYRLGTYLYETKKYPEAKKYLKSYLDFAFNDDMKNKEAELLLFRSELIEHPVQFNPLLVKDLSTIDPEYLAVLSPDNELCFFTRRFEEVNKGSLTPLSVEKFMIAKKQPDGKFSKGEPMAFPFNQSTSNNEGGASISKDNKIIYFTKNENGNFDLYYSELIKGKWSEIKNLGENVNDSKQWDSQPSISPDGRTLYFASYRDSVNGTSDIMMSKKIDGTFSKATTLPFNTNGNEKSPFIHQDNKTLYFASDSLPGMGGFDIFVIKKNNGGWGKPVNLGYPINTESDEVGFFISTDGENGYFASNKLAGAGGYDIYSFEMPADKRPDKVLFVKGQLKGENEAIPLAAKIELKNVSTSELFEVDYDSLTGNYASVVLFDADYIMTVKKEGYAYNSQYFSQSDTASGAVVNAHLDLKKLNVGEAYKLNNILFATSSAELTFASKVIVKDFADFLVQNPKVIVSIHGHTDNEGSEASNMKLSNDRAKAVYEYLISCGINASRLSYKGFGQSRPVALNDSEEGKAKNRRTEFVIVNK
jgi:outer membrane protein OmpA-like peptidoglycan-associated protein/tetratricopeptide (TPR) repeat protein